MVRGWLLLVPVLIACSSSSETSSSPADAGADTNADGSAACVAFARTHCARLVECADFFVRYGFGDVATCEARTNLACKLWLGTPGVLATTANVEACTSGSKTAACGDVLTGRTCSLPTGTRDNGQPCSVAQQCKSGLCATGAGGCGTCAPEPGEGEPCVAGQCGPTRRCFGMGLCVTPKKAGEECSGPGACELPLSCFMGRCSSPAPLDAACDPESKTAPDCNFLIGHLCVANTCVLSELALAGQPCGYLAGKLTLCGGGGACRIAEGESTGTCVAPVADGEACDEMASRRCVTPATCVEGICRLPDPALCR